MVLVSGFVNLGSVLSVEVNLGELRGVLVVANVFKYNVLKTFTGIKQSWWI